MSEFELGILRARLVDAARAKARRGELRIPVPIGYVWHREGVIAFDPNERLQEAIRVIFSRFRKLGSARQVLLSLAGEQMHFPRPSDGKQLVSFDWTPLRYNSVIRLLKNPFYAGAYAYGKSEKRSTVIDGRLRKTYGHDKPFGQWEVMIQDHHPGYIEWAEFERNQKLLAANNFGKPGGSKSGRGGRALLPGMLVCGQCGRRLSVLYTGRVPQAVYRCERPNQIFGRRRCLSFGANRIEAAVTRELLRAVEPMAIEAALQAESRYMELHTEQQRMAELDLQQARYEVSLAERRYAACDPQNRLIAAQLEKSWEATLQRAHACEERLRALQNPGAPTLAPDFADLAEDLEAAWNAPGVTMRARQQLLRTLIVEIIAHYDERSREITLTIHWKGGQHSQLKVQKPKSGEHGCRTSEEALAVMHSMAGRWSDVDIAASLNRMGVPTGTGKTWNARRVASMRMLNDIRAYRSAEKDGEWITMTEAATQLGVSNHVIRRLIKDGVLVAEQVVALAPYQIRASDLQSEPVREAIARKGRPCRSISENQNPLFPTT